MSAQDNRLADLETFEIFAGYLRLRAVDQYLSGCSSILYKYTNLLNCLK